MLNKVHKGSSLHFHRLAVSVIQSQDKVEEVGLAEVGRRLFLEVSSGQSDSTVDRAQISQVSLSLSKTSKTYTVIYRIV